MVMIALVIIGGISLLVLIIFATVKTKSTNISKYEPFKAWVGKTITLDKETALFKDKVEMNYNRDYPYVLLDSLHPKWEYVEEQKAIGDLEEIARFPAGTALTFEKAIQYTNGVSGFSYPTILVTITSNGKEYKADYQ